SYYVSATNKYGCGATSNTVKISFLPQLFANIKKAKDSLYVITNRPIKTYIWYKDTILYNTTSWLYHPPTGRYTVTVTDADGCMANSGSLLHTGVNTIIENNLHIYPNPVRDMLYIEGLWLVGDNTNHGQKTNIALYDMHGKKVYAAADAVTNGENNYKINVSSFPKGIYIILVGDVMQKIVIE
ncbi:MAG: T9SS type A sorting domain-containing protein, partial [Bacteroidota bacterium]|nr:T9SS type A sorting domain-containing protein [Bacteroidota bacterium]